jgi:two-component system cell cycle response regulator DivK
VLVLLVDDDEDCRRIYRLALEHAGHAVMLAHDGLEGLRIAKEEEPDLVLMDISMPNLDGFAALKRLRAHGATKDLRIVAITAAAAYYDVAEFAAAGFDGLLTKPVGPKELVEAVGAYHM